jgi:RNA recognition motif-containing protein
MAKCQPAHHRLSGDTADSNRLDIIAKKHDKGRGQAFVVFSDQTAATSALRGLTGEEFYGKKLDIAYAKKPSNATIARDDPSKSREAAAIQAAKLVVSRAQGEYEQLEKEREDQENGLGKRTLDEGEQGRESKRPRQDADEDEMEIEMEDDEDGQRTT